MSVEPDRGGCEVADLIVIHRVLRSVFDPAPGLVERAGDDPERHTLIDAHLVQITGALHRHHHGEDLTLWDRLADRRPACALHVERMRAQHAEIAALLGAVDRAHRDWQRDRQDGATALVDALHTLNRSLDAHLSEEEPFVTEHAPQLLSQDEWNEMRDHGIRTTPRDRLLVELGYVLRALDTDAERATFWASVPIGVRVLYRLFGERKLSRELTALYGAD